MILVAIIYTKLIGTKIELYECPANNTSSTLAALADKYYNKDEV